jgi:hypothetical protein
MANTVENTFNKIGDTIERILGSKTDAPSDIVSNGGKSSPLEMYGMQARNYHLMRNEWRKDLQYTKSLVNSEYMIQTEFKVK